MNFMNYRSPLFLIIEKQCIVAYISYIFCRLSCNRLATYRDESVLLFRSLEVINRFDSADDLRRRLDVLDDLVHALIRHWRLVKRVGDYASGVNPRHLLLVLRRL